MSETLGKMAFVPMFRTMAMTMVARKRRGSIQEPHMMNRMMSTMMQAMPMTRLREVISACESTAGPLMYTFDPSVYSRIESRMSAASEE